MPALERADGLVPALEAAFKAGGVHLVLDFMEPAFAPGRVGPVSVQPTVRLASAAVDRVLHASSISYIPDEVWRLWSALVEQFGQG
jgi:hypothetical protein